jgi:alpha-beta hydrolase superfamily lysophospholipase
VKHTAPPSRRLVLGIDPDAVAGTFHESASSNRATMAVLICPPWGWDEITSYRALRTWAERLAAGGRPTLRIDLPGTGDSAGHPNDPDRVPAWRAAVAGSAAFLAGLPGISRVVVVGLGLGGLIAAAASTDGAPIDELVLWAAPASGRAFLREQRAWAAMQSARLDRPDGDAAVEAVIGQERWEIGGFVLTAETMAALAPLDLAELVDDRVRRVLMLDRDGIGRTPKVGEALRRSGVDVAEEKGAGWAAMVFHPERYAPPEAVFERVDAWLDAAPEPHPERATTASIVAPPADPALEHDVRGVTIRETAIVIGQPFGQLFGVLSEPVGAGRAGPSAVFLNAGAVRRIGPNRLWVEAARSWAARGVPSLRIDLEGIGDTDGDAGRYRDVGNFYTDAIGGQVRAVLDELDRRDLGPPFILVGLCAGGYWAFHTAATDRRVIASLILNPRALQWDAGLLTRREARKMARLGTRTLWTSILRGEVPLGRLRAVSGAALRGLLRSAGRAPGRLLRRRGSGSPDPIVARLDALRDLGTRVVIAFSGEEPVRDELEAAGLVARLGRWPNVSLTSLPGDDHTLRPMAAQEAALALLECELDRVLAPTGPSAAAGSSPRTPSPARATPRPRPDRSVPQSGRQP